ncbi:MAG: Sporulation initiation phosphotransferase (Spo0F) [Candidatus Carbobacillus altaicus]|uniref:Sporulation initiation phosphotransferase (Spo0F) n=1 Tax=Candidatus Carbonibacillus altaicus TaxID=2163959 RepID=A0A2R6Y437_9BACL|nr:MAG: Sporulation initiation phosphotransferase (Spo0F) [Candidatus Carbobacillus altaicus]
MKQLLVVDDQPGIRALLKEIFRREGYEVLEAADAEEGLSVCLHASHTIGLILLDIKLPGMNGIDFLRQLRMHGGDIPVVLMTAYGEVEQLEEAKRLGVQDFFSKPFDIDEIKQVVRHYLNHQ